MFCGRIAFKLISINFLQEKYISKIKHKGDKTKRKSMKPKLLKVLNINQF